MLTSVLQTPISRKISFKFKSPAN